MKITDTLLAEAAQQAYNADPQIEGFKRYIISADNHQAVIFQNEEERYTFRVGIEKKLSFIIAIAGTNDLKDLLEDSMAWKVPTPFGKIHAGFWQGFYELNGKLHGFFRAVLDSYSPVWITGHSLGGAEALLTAAEYSQSINIARVTTFGCPRVGNYDWYKFFNNLSILCRRYVNDQDIVCRIPRLWYWHVGNAFYFDSGGALTNKLPRSWFIGWRKIDGLKDHDMARYRGLMERHGF